MDMTTPFERSWWVVDREVLAGCCPGPDGAAPEQATLEALFAAGVRSIVSLIPADERDKTGALRKPYEDDWFALGRAHGIEVAWLRAPIPDMGVTSYEAMESLVGYLGAVERVVYIHCWGGSGRTGTVAGCYLTKQGLSPEKALTRIRQARSYSPQLAGKASPQTDEQLQFIHQFAE